MRLFQAFDVDEETPVQFLGVYTTRWRPEWGKPQIMFKEVDDPVYEAALDLLAACEVVMREDGHYSECPCSGDYSHAHMPHSHAIRTCEQLQAAIAKAKGGSDNDVGDVITSSTEST